MYIPFFIVDHGVLLSASRRYCANLYMNPMLDGGFRFVNKQRQTRETNLVPLFGGEWYSIKVSVLNGMEKDACWQFSLATNCLLYMPIMFI